MKLTARQTGEYEVSQSGPWSVRESFVAILVSNAPIVFPLFKRWFESITGMASTFKSSKSDSYQLDSQIKHSQSGSSFPKESKKKKFHHPLSIPRTTEWGSQEEIVTMDQQVMGAGGRGAEKKDGSDAKSADDSGGSLEMEDTDQERNTNSRQGTPRTFRPDRDILVLKQWEVADTR